MSDRHQTMARPQQLICVCLRALLGAAFTITCAVGDVTDARRTIRYADIAPALRAPLQQLGVDEQSFDAYITSLNRRTAERETIGENDHLIYFILQSERFTRQSRIEPALSAAEFVRRLSAEEKARYLKEPSFLPPIERLPAMAAERFNDFIKSLKKPGADERLNYF
ncbi:MAG: hypothetical protein M3R15_16295, partial [Acidobacteriota bacterium]|nr:hypothetical protein [Acidobacteriota bacterium]